MSFKCQQDPYLSFFSSVVKSCTENEFIVGNGKTNKVSGYEVILEDTVLFPEGGGQPYDLGTLNDKNVLKVLRNGGEAVHFMEDSLTVGETVNIKVDWDRRFDHMQQHSGQHLITAITDQLYGFKTTSWDLGQSVSFIELDTNVSNVKDDKILAIEEACNKAIRNKTEVNVIVTEVGSEKLENVRARGLPDDHVGPVRIIEICGIDSNMCCGTHVSNMSELMCVKLLHSEKGKKGKCNLYFLVGNRVTKFVARCHNTDKELTKLLKCGTNEHVEAVGRTLKQFKLAQKSNTILLRDIALLEAKQFQSMAQNGQKFITKHRKEGNNEYMNIIANQMESESCCMLLTVGEDKGEGLFLLFGSDKFLQDCGDNVINSIEGRGAKKGNRIQGKAKNLKQLKNAILSIEEYMKSN